MSKPVRRCECRSQSVLNRCQRFGCEDVGIADLPGQGCSTHIRADCLCPNPSRLPARLLDARPLRACAHHGLVALPNIANKAREDAQSAASNKSWGQLGPRQAVNAQTDASNFPADRRAVAASLSEQVHRRQAGRNRIPERQCLVNGGETQHAFCPSRIRMFYPDFSTRQRFHHAYVYSLNSPRLVGICLRTAERD